MSKLNCQIRSLYPQLRDDGRQSLEICHEFSLGRIVIDRLCFLSDWCRRHRLLTQIAEWTTRTLSGLENEASVRTPLGRVKQEGGSVWRRQNAPQLPFELTFMYYLIT